jgi:hypothetical protein
MRILSAHHGDSHAPLALPARGAPYLPCLARVMPQRGKALRVALSVERRRRDFCQVMSARSISVLVSRRVCRGLEVRTFTVLCSFVVAPHVLPA